MVTVPIVNPDIVEARMKLPATVKDVAAIVPVYPVQVTDLAVPEEIVTVPPPELALKKTSSAVVGTDAPPAPPDVADQLVVEEAFHVPVPPTQYLFAMLYLD
jgi:hypothetical protein